MRQSHFFCLISIQVSTDDGLPNKVCSVCKSNIVNFFTFKEKSKRTEIVLRTTLRPKTSSIAYVAVDEAQHNETVSNEPVKKEKSESLPPPSTIKIEKALVVPHSAPINKDADTAAPLPAPSSPPPIVEEDSLLNDHHQEEPDTTDADNDVDLILNCEICDESFDTLDGLKDHCEATHEEEDSIERHNIKEEVIIDDDVDDVLSVYEDGEDEEDEEVVADHDGSDETYVDEEYTEIDQLDDFGDADFLCHCGTSFANNEKLQIHVKTHHDEMDVDPEDELHTANQNEFRCILCDISLGNRDQLIMHYNELHEYFCDECIVVFVSKDELLQHNVDEHKTQKPKPQKSTATSVQEFRCSHCDKSIRGQLKFDQHQKLHDSMNVINNYVTFYPVKAYIVSCHFLNYIFIFVFSCSKLQCHQCHLIFLTEDEGNAHRNFHEENDEKPTNDQFVDASCTDYQFLDEDGYDDNEYSCGICNILLSNAADAKYHLVSHSAVFTCPYDVCGCQYDNFGRYTSHIMNKHVNGQDHRCSHCDQKFNSFDELQAHMKLKCSERKFACNHCGTFFFNICTIFFKFL